MRRERQVEPTFRSFVIAPTHDALASARRGSNRENTSRICRFALGYNIYMRGVNKTWLSKRPRVCKLDRLLSLDDCSQLVRLAAGQLGACDLSEIAHAASHERSSTGCWLPRFDSPQSAWHEFGASENDANLVSRVEAIIAEACGVPASHGEPAQILRYRAGQRYDLHPDFFNPRDRDELANGGQRIITCLVYLTSVPEACGGATYFPRAKCEHTSPAQRILFVSQTMRLSKSLSRLHLSRFPLLARSARPALCWRRHLLS